MNGASRWKTSGTHPLRIDAVAIPGTAAALGMTLCPGKKQPGGSSGPWWRDLDTDLAAIRDWGAAVLVTLFEDHEFRALQVTGLPRRARAHGLDWRHWPIRDQQAPDARFRRHWEEEFPGLRRRIRSGESLVLHCMGGLGRTGMVAARILREFGVAPREAVRRVRAARPGAIETDAQLHWVGG